jgi:hypothetical protein
MKARLLVLPRLYMPSFISRRRPREPPFALRVPDVPEYNCRPVVV